MLPSGGCCPINKHIGMMSHLLCSQEHSLFRQYYFGMCLWQYFEPESYHASSPGTKLLVYVALNHIKPHTFVIPFNRREVDVSSDQ